jgi:hypothetical protein
VKKGILPRVSRLLYISHNVFNGQCKAGWCACNVANATCKLKGRSECTRVVYERSDVAHRERLRSAGCRLACPVPCRNAAAAADAGAAAGCVRSAALAGDAAPVMVVIVVDVACALR